MSVAQINYKGKNTTILCKGDDLLKDIVNKFASKNSIKASELYFAWNGETLSETKLNTTFQKITNNGEKMLNLLAYDYDDNKHDNTCKDVLFESKEIICPQCKENSIITIKDY